MDGLSSKKEGVRKGISEMEDGILKLPTLKNKEIH